MSLTIIRKNVLITCNLGKLVVGIYQLEVFDSVRRQKCQKKIILVEHMIDKLLFHMFIKLFVVNNV